MYSTLENCMFSLLFVFWYCKAGNWRFKNFKLTCLLRYSLTREAVIGFSAGKRKVIRDGNNRSFENWSLRGGTGTVNKL